MNGRRALLRGLALLPAALKPMAQAVTSAGLSVGSPVGMQSLANPVPPPLSFAQRKAMSVLRLFDRKRDRRRLGQLAGIDVDLWAVRSYSHVYRAMRQADRHEGEHSEYRLLRRAIGWATGDDDE